MKLMHPLFAMYAVMAAILGGLMLSGCGDGLNVQTYPQVIPSNPTAPLCDLGTVARCYDACLARNPNYYGSPAWLYWIDQCKKRWGVYTQPMAYPERPYAVGGDV